MPVNYITWLTTVQLTCRVHLCMEYLIYTRDRCSHYRSYLALPTSADRPKLSTNYAVDVVFSHTANTRLVSTQADDTAMMSVLNLNSVTV